MRGDSGSHRFRRPQFPASSASCAQAAVSAHTAHTASPTLWPQIELAPAGAAAAAGSGESADGEDGAAAAGEPVKMIESEFVADRIVRLLPKLDWAALRKTAAEVRGAAAAMLAPSHRVHRSSASSPMIAARGRGAARVHAGAPAR